MTCYSDAEVYGMRREEIMASTIGRGRSPLRCALGSEISGVMSAYLSDLYHLSGIWHWRLDESARCCAMTCLIPADGYIIKADPAVLWRYKFAQHSYEVEILFSLGGTFRGWPDSLMRLISET